MVNYVYNFLNIPVSRNKLILGVDFYSSEDTHGRPRSRLRLRNRGAFLCSNFRVK